jgi:isobutyryl-CoA mutase
VLATPICDGHDAAISAITRILRSEGVEAVYIGFNKTPYQIVKAAVEEDATGIALSSYNGGHMSFFREVLKEQKAQGIPHVPLFCGGGGTILAREVAPLEKDGRGEGLSAADGSARRDPGHGGAGGEERSARRPAVGRANGFTAMARSLSQAEWSGRNGHAGGEARRGVRRRRRAGLGHRGRGGAGKSTIVDELVYRFLHATKGRIAVLSVDPTLGDRLRMLHCYSPRVYMRSVRLGAGNRLRSWRRWWRVAARGIRSGHCGIGGAWARSIWAWRRSSIIRSSA